MIATGGTGNIRYSRISNTPEFVIDGTTGIIRLNRTLNFETRSTYTFRLRAESVGTTVTGDLDVNINVQDVNERPFFTTSCAMSAGGCTFDINENQEATVVGQIVADDLDLSSVLNGMLTYQLSSLTLPFSVDMSGNLRTTRSLDREARSSYRFSVIVRDRCSGCALSVQTNVLVTVNDLNDNSPVFTVGPATAEVSEDAGSGVVVAEYRATDADVGTNAAITFAFAPSNFPFSLSPTGTLTLTGAIDFEATQSYTVTITASNPGSSRSTATNTIIQILNVNDNSPVISGEPYSDVVVENSAATTPVLTVVATDGDLGIHGQIRYSIIGGNFQNSFALNPSSGALTVNRNIDRETITSFSLLVEARDRGTPQSRRDRTTIAITISDVNDNRPIFRPDMYNLQLREDLPVSQNVVRVIASDDDQPNTPNSNISYSFLSGNSADKFRILSNGQIQINSALDFENTSSYTLVVEGRDGGMPVMSGMASVSVTITNVNEDPPTLSGNQSVFVSELTGTESTIAIFQAQDQDNMAVTISIVSGNSEQKFNIGESTGAITLAASLDYETTTSYSLIIRASDGQQVAESSLAVTVLDENEFTPTFSGPTDFNTTEEDPSGSRVGSVSATDGDRDAIVTYEFVGQDKTTEKFILNPTTGVITTSRVLNREDLTQVFSPPLSKVTVEISARDNGSPSMRSVRAYTITLVDINDNTPMFSDQSYSNRLLENLSSGQAVFTAAATDPDLGSNAQVSYSFTLTNNKGGPSIPFQINSATGAIETTEPLDCELQPFYLFSITATDAGSTPRSSTVVGNLTLIDVNDNPPIFSPEKYRVNVSEQFTPGDIVMTFLATDADKGVNGEVEYSIMSNTNLRFVEGTGEEVAFEIQSVSGELLTLNSFDFETAPQVNVTIFANDKGLPRRSATATLVIDVLNVDEDPPLFSGISCDSMVSEDASVGTVVTSCVATDPDTVATGNQRPITYSMTNQFFEVDPTSGDIRIGAALDRETTGGVILSIRATDIANRVTTRRVVVRVSDVNDNSPEFLGTPYRYHFTDSSIQSYTQEFFTVQVRDPDLGSNGTFYFNVGRIFRVTDTETRVEVIARDNGSPQLDSTTNVTVTFQSPCQLQTYSITREDGRLSAQLLCSIEASPAPSIALVLGGSSSLICKVLRNSPTGYQWLHNGTTFTNTMPLGQTRPEVSLPLGNIRFSNAGEYACKASSQAGSLQSPASTATIQGMYMCA